MKINAQILIPIFLTGILLSAGLLAYSGAMSAGDLFVGCATIVLALATFSLGWSEIESNRKERTRERLKERLEGLYSPLMGLGSDFEYPEFHLENSPNEVYGTMEKIRNIYSYLASSFLKVRLDLYYKEYHTTNNMPDRLELDNLRVLFTKDYEDIVKEYKGLTLSKTEEKTDAEKLKKE
jgi:hypothetical protein